MVDSKKIRLPQMDAEAAADEIGNFIVEILLRFNKTGGVVGLSGGVDSTVAAALAKRAFDKHKLELVGYIIPSKINHKQDLEDAVKVAQKLGIRYEIVEIDEVVKAFEKTNPKSVKNPFHKGNLISEARAVVLHAKAAVENKSVIGTGNHDEDFGIGYYTLFGDGAVHLSPIGCLSKRLVRQMAVHLGFEQIAEKESTAALEQGQTDFKDLGYHYDVVELFVEGFNQGLTIEELVKNDQIASLAEKQMIEYEKKFEKKKFECVKEIVDDILKRHKNSALPKSELLTPKIPKITLRYE